MAQVPATVYFTPGAGVGAMTCLPAGRIFVAVFLYQARGTLRAMFSGRTMWAGDLSQLYAFTYS